jgi:outer membrane protein OmpA-like peptidoglycan-associated protein
MSHRSVFTALAAGAVLAGALTACATTARPGSIAQAQQIHDSLTAAGANRQVEGDLIRTRRAIAVADSAVDRSASQEVVDGLGQIALRHAQTAEARSAALRAAAQADSLRTQRLSTQLAQTEAQRQEASARAASEGARADSLRQVAEETGRRLNEALTNIRQLVTEITNLQETTRGLVISLSDVLFDVNRATLRTGAEQNVRRIADILRQYPNNQISVEGHTDATGADAYNQRLSEERAASVRAALVSGGVPAANITSRGFGKTQPVATNATAEGRQRNRRVEVVVLGAGSLADAARSQQPGQAMSPGVPATPLPTTPPTDSTEQRPE